MFIPGPITGVIGEIGSGKSFSALKIAFEFAETHRYIICTNMPLNGYYLHKYFEYKGYTWLLHCLYNNDIIVRPLVDRSGRIALENFMSESKCLYILDEAGIFLSSRNFRDVPLQFLASLAQARKDSRRLFWISQYASQVDKVLRSLTASFIHCESMVRYSKQLGNTEMVLCSWKMFTSKNYDIYSSKLSGKKNGLKMFFQSRSLALKCRNSRVTELDKLLFSSYQSFSRLDSNDISLSNPPSRLFSVNVRG